MKNMFLQELSILKNNTNDPQVLILINANVQFSEAQFKQALVFYFNWLFYIPTYTKYLKLFTN